MRHIWLVSLIRVLCLAACIRESCGTETVHIGAIFSLQSIQGKTSLIALQSAVDDINSDPNVLGGRVLAVHIRDTQASGFLSLVGGLQLMERDIVAIIGPQSSVTAHLLSHIGNRLHIPLLTFTALDPMFSPIQFPYLVQTAPNDLMQMKAVANMVSHFGWELVTAIFSDQDQYRNGITVLEGELTARRCKISHKAALPPGSLADEIWMENVLNQIKMVESRVIVVHTAAEVGLRLLKKVEKLNMMVDGYVWITTSWFSTFLDAQSRVHPERDSSFQGVITLRHHTREFERKKQFASRWTHLTNGSIGLTAYSLYAYDTVWMIASALKKFYHLGYNISFSDDPYFSSYEEQKPHLRTLRNFNGGSKLLKLILATNMTGLTGPIRYINKRRSLFQPSLEILNVAENQVRLIGYWSNMSGLSVEPPYTSDLGKPRNLSYASGQLHEVIWPGGRRKRPRGWVFPNNGRKLRIGIPFRVSFPGFTHETNNHSHHIAAGYSLDVFRAAVKLLPYPLPYEFIWFGNRLENPSYTKLVNQVTTNVFDAAVGDIAVVCSRTEYLDFTQPYAASGLVIVVRAKEMNSSVWTCILPFTASMWAVTLIFFLVMTAVIWILEHKFNDEFHGSPKKQFMSAVLFSFSTAFNKQEETVSLLGTTMLVIWLSVIWIIQSGYKSSLGSYLTVQQLSSQITGIDSLTSSIGKIGFQVGSYAENYLTEALHIPKSRLKVLHSPEEYAQALLDGTVAAVVDERPYVDLFLSEHCQFLVVGEQLTHAGWGFAFPKGSPLALDMSDAILRLSEEGTLQNITEKWQAFQRTTCFPPNSSQQLQLRHFLGPFLVCGFTCFAAVLLHLWKVTRRYKRSHEISSSCVARTMAFLYFLERRDDKEIERKRKKRRTSSSCSSFLPADQVVISSCTDTKCCESSNLQSIKRVEFCSTSEEYKRGDTTPDLIELAG